MADHPKQVEGFISLAGGQDAGRAADLLGETQYALGINTSSRDGLLHSRPAFIQTLKLEVPLDAVFKGAFTMRRRVGDVIFMCFGQNLYLYDVNEQELSVVADVVDASASRLFFCQSGELLVIQDDVVGETYEEANWPLIFEGTTHISEDYASDRETEPENQLPKGQMMAFGHGRIFVAVEWVWNGSDAFVKQSRRSFIACDTFKAWDPKNVLRATEQHGSSGGAITLSAELGEINAMAFQRNVESGTGHGPLVVMASHGASTYRVDLPRALVEGEDWASSQFGRILYQNTGLLATASVASVNNDLIIRGTDGIRTVRYTASEAQAGNLDLSVEPISREVHPWMIDRDVHQPYMSGAFADNRYLVTALHEFRGSDDIDQPFAWEGLVAMDTAQQARLGSTAPPVYDGLWTGLKFYSVVAARYQGKDIHFIIGAPSGGFPGLWNLQSGANDRAADSTETRIKSRIFTKNYYFGSLFDQKELLLSEVLLRDVFGAVDVRMYYRADGYDLWKLAGTASVVASGTYGGRTRPLRIGVETGCDPSGAPMFLHIGNSFQFCLEWEGHCTFGGTRWVTRLMQRSEYTMCDVLELLTEAVNGLLSLPDVDYEVLYSPVEEIEAPSSDVLPEGVEAPTAEEEDLDEVPEPSEEDLQGVIDGGVAPEDALGD